MVLGDPIADYTRPLHFRGRRGVTVVIRRVFARSFRFAKLQGPRPRRCLSRRGARSAGKRLDALVTRWASGRALGRVTPGMRALMRACSDRGWVPVGAQVPVVWPAARLATCIDLVLHDAARDRLVVVEVKSGCAYRHLHHGYLSHIRPRVTNSPLHQHQLLTVLGKELLARTYPHWARSSIDMALVYVADDGTIDLITGDRFGVAFTPEIAAALERT